MDGGAWSATVHGVARSRTRLSDFSFFLDELKRSGKARGSSLAALKKKKEKTILSGDEWLHLPGTHTLPNFLICDVWHSTRLQESDWKAQVRFNSSNEVERAELPGAVQVTHLLVVAMVFSHSVISNSLQPHGLPYARLPCPSVSPRVCSNSCPLSQWCHPTMYPLLPPCLPAFILSQHQGVFQWVGCSHQVAKVLGLQLQHQSF